MSCKKIYITGIGSGIGKELAKLFLRDNFVVYGSIRNGNQERQLLEDIPDLHIEIADLSTHNGIYIVGETIKKQNFDIIIFCAGYGKIGNFSSLAENDVFETFYVNTLAPICITQNNIKTLTQTKLVYISSIFAQIPFPGAAIYSASKSAISHFYRSIRNEYPNLSLLCLEIGAVKTPMHIKAGMKESVGKDVSIATRKIYQTILHKEGKRNIYFTWKIQIYTMPIIFYIQYIIKKYLGKKYSSHEGQVDSGKK